MTLYKEQFRIESARHPNWDYSSHGWYFVTICTKGKRCLLGSARDGEIVLSKAGSIAGTEIRHIADHYSNVTVDCFVVMPNHIHAIIVIAGRHIYSPERAGAIGRDGASPVSTLGNVVGGYKAGVSRFCRAAGITNFAWQDRYHDHILRSPASVTAVRDYIAQNPANWAQDSDYFKG